MGDRGKIDLQIKAGGREGGSEGCCQRHKDPVSISFALHQPSIWRDKIQCIIICMSWGEGQSIHCPTVSRSGIHKHEAMFMQTHSTSNLSPRCECVWLIVKFSWLATLAHIGEEVCDLRAHIKEKLRFNYTQTHALYGQAERWEEVLICVCVWCVLCARAPAEV